MTTNVTHIELWSAVSLAFYCLPTSSLDHTQDHTPPLTCILLSMYLCPVKALITSSHLSILMFSWFPTHNQQLAVIFMMKQSTSMKMCAQVNVDKTQQHIADWYISITSTWVSSSYLWRIYIYHSTFGCDVSVSCCCECHPFFLSFKGGLTLVIAATANKLFCAKTLLQQHAPTISATGKACKDHLNHSPPPPCHFCTYRSTSINPCLPNFLVQPFEHWSVQ